MNVLGEGGRALYVRWMTPPSFAGMSHVALTVSDLQQSVQWYVDTLGFVVLFPYDTDSFIGSRDTNRLPGPGRGSAGGVQAGISSTSTRVTR